MHQRDILISRRNGSGDGLKPVGYSDHGIGFQIIQHIGEFHHSQSGGLGHGGWIFAFQYHKYFGRDWEAIFFDKIYRISVPVQKCGAGNDQL